MKQIFQGGCHCGHIRFEVRAEVDHLRICDCSICHKRGALIHRIPQEELTLFTPLSEMTLYQWGSHTAQDYFCPVCGILPFRRPSHPTPEEQFAGVLPFDGWAVNARCLEGLDTTAIRRVAIQGSKIRQEP